MVISSISRIRRLSLLKVIIKLELHVYIHRNKCACICFMCGLVDLGPDHPRQGSGSAGGHLHAPFQLGEENVATRH